MQQAPRQGRNQLPDVIPSKNTTDGAERERVVLRKDYVSARHEGDPREVSLIGTDGNSAVCTIGIRLP